MSNKKNINLVLKKKIKKSEVENLIQSGCDALDKFVTILKKDIRMSSIDEKNDRTITTKRC